MFEVFSFSADVHTPTDLKPGMVLPGSVTKVANFEAFVEIGDQQNGWAHMSELCDIFIKDLKDYIKVQQQVNVIILDVDLERQRIVLSRKGLLQPKGIKLPGIVIYNR